METASMPRPSGPIGLITIASTAVGALRRNPCGSSSASCPNHQAKNSRSIIKNHPYPDRYVTESCATLEGGWRICRLTTCKFIEFRPIKAIATAAFSTIDKNCCLTSRCDLARRVGFNRNVRIAVQRGGAAIKSGQRRRSPLAKARRTRMSPGIAGPSHCDCQPAA